MFVILSILLSRRKMYCSPSLQGDAIRFSDGSIQVFRSNDVQL